MLYKICGKRILDILLSGIALIVFAIPMLIVAFMVNSKIGSPVIFTQARIGKDNRRFMLMKFRSMTEERDENGVYLPDLERLRPFGKKLRLLSIDELPSLLNILKGEMSIIGPRPLPCRYLERYTCEQQRRHELRPGLSSPAILNGRNSQTWEEQFEAEVGYVDNVSFLLDCKIILKTIGIVIKREGATAKDGDCRSEFIGIANIEELMDTDKNYMKIAR